MVTARDRRKKNQEESYDEQSIQTPHGALADRATAAGAAVSRRLADDQTADTWYFGGTGQETFYEATPLPNGRLLLNGSTQLGRNGQDQLPFASGERRAWLLCLNPDMSIAWEVIDGAQGTTRYVVPQVLADGRIAVLYYNSPSQVTEAVAIRYFTQDGRACGEVSLPATAPVWQLPGDRARGAISFPATRWTPSLRMNQEYTPCPTPGTPL